MERGRLVVSATLLECCALAALVSVFMLLCAQEGSTGLINNNKGMLIIPGLRRWKQQSQEFEARFRNVMSEGCGYDEIY